ncbi:hypothetical protein D3C85_1675100 [compost metagenome]
MARILAKVSSGVPKRFMCSMPALPKMRRAAGISAAPGIASLHCSRNSSSGLGRSAKALLIAPGIICSKPKARTMSTMPLLMAWLARYSADEPLAQLLFTLSTGMPVMPTL